MLTRILRQKGTLNGLITDMQTSPEEMISQLQSREMNTFVQDTSITRPYIVPGRGKRIAVIDFGMKHSILHELTERNCHVTVVPYDYKAEDVLRFKPDGILLSHGPGDPTILRQTIKTIKQLLGVPMLGIGLGHQLLAIACGAETKKINGCKYGNNFPVKELHT